MAKALKFAADGGIVDVDAFPKTVAEKDRFMGVTLKACDIMEFETPDMDAAVHVVMYFPEITEAARNAHDPNIKGDFVVGVTVDFVLLSGDVISEDRDYDVLFTKEQLINIVASHAAMMTETKAFLDGSCQMFPQVDVDARKRMDAVVAAFYACECVDRDDLWSKVYTDLCARECVSGVS